MTGTIQSLMAELKDGLAVLYGTRLKGVYLYGSYARHEAHHESDVDVLIVLDEIPTYAAEIERTGELISSLSLQHGVSVSRVFVPEVDWVNRETPFLANVREEAVRA
ncbi:MAG: nucleotidyltransferase domain-containing protein [Nitrospirota bacterium]|nr:nucleotidyltransferase domain-containing protein [Nitrospirota bacterium]MDE3225746.1 nucleotidyltransferase domain-containing protein [Nitrospirota bacterium]